MKHILKDFSSFNKSRFLWTLRSNVMTSDVFLKLYTRCIFPNPFLDTIAAFEVHQMMQIFAKSVSVSVRSYLR